MTGIGRKDDSDDEASDGLARPGSEQSSTPNNIQEAFRILGLTPDAPLSEVRRAYRDTVRERHPDKGGSAEEFYELQDAKDRLEGYFGERL